MAKRTTSRKKSADTTASSAAASRSGKAARKACGGNTPPQAAKAAAVKPPSGKSPLSRAQMKRFRQMLLDKRRELVGDMTGIEAEALGADRGEIKGDISDHPADAGTDNFEQEFSLGLLESERVLLGEIDEALQRVEEGTFGVCLGTGQPISATRLEARPWAKYGIEYARMVEKGLVRPGERIGPLGEDDEDAGRDDEDDDD